MAAGETIEVDRLRLVAGWFVIIAWGCSFVLSGALPDYQTPDGLSALMGIVTGALFAPTVLDLVTKHRNDNHS